MKPLFTIHGGEYLVGSYIEEHFKRVNVWIPSRDTGVDLLITDLSNGHTLSLQVKFSKDFLAPDWEPEFQRNLRACCWFTIDEDKLRKSTADFWVFVLLGFARRTTDYVVVPPSDLLRRFQLLGRSKTIQTYLWVTERGKCWETRGLPRNEQLRLARDEFQQPDRDLTTWLNNWNPVAQVNGTAPQVSLTGANPDDLTGNRVVERSTPRRG